MCYEYAGLYIQFKILGNEVIRMTPINIKGLSFDDFIIDLLANNEVELKKAPVLQFLSDKGYLARRRYSNIETLIIKANAQRNRKDTD